MKNKRIAELSQGFTTAFVDQSVSSNLAFKPQFISNNYKQGRKVLSSIEDELLVCDEFCISVAFITMSGITPLLQILKKLEKRNIKGRILTTNYSKSLSWKTQIRQLLKLNGCWTLLYGRIFTSIL